MQKRLTKSTGLRFALLAGIVALVQMRILVLMFGPQYKLSVDAAAGVLRGEPHWRVYQNRLLGPWLVQVASHVFDTFLDAHVFCSVVLLGVSGFVVLWQLSRIHADTGRTLAGYFAFALLVVCCFQRPWFYIWDCVDLLIFVLFNAFVVRQRSWRWFAALFAVAILNREGAYFIALWMIVDPLVRRVLDRGRRCCRRPVGPDDARRRRRPARRRSSVGRAPSHAAARA